MSAAPAPAAMAEELEATRQRKRRKKHRVQAEVAAASSESSRPPAIPDSKPEYPAPVAPETLTSTAVAAGKGRKRKKQEAAAASQLVEAVRKEEKKKRKISKCDDTAAAAQILEVAAEGATTRKKRRRGEVQQEEEEAAVDGGVSGRKSVKNSSSGKPQVLSDREIRMRIESRKQQPVPQGFVPPVVNPNSIDQNPKYSSPFGAFFDQFCYKPDRRQGRNAPSLPKTPEHPASLPPRDHLSSKSSQLTANSLPKTPERPARPPPQDLSSQLTANETCVSGGKSVKRSSSGKPRVLSDREIIRMRIELRKQQPVPQGLVPLMVNPNSIDKDPKYSSPFGAFFDQFRYKPDRQQGRNAPSLPKTPEHPSRSLPQDHLSSPSSQVTANETFMAAKTTTSNTKQPHPDSALCPQEEVKVKEKKRPEKKMSRMDKPRKKPPLLSIAEKRSDKYRRLPLNQLVPPPRSPHKLLQEKYASDPWKVVVICMLLNLTQGKQVRKKVKGFFKRYPDAQTAYAADPEKMAKYLAPLGLQRVKATRIQKFSKAYVEDEWTYITELCGVGKYAADAYAIFCAGRATEVVPEDHKLVDYWKYVCFELPLIQASQNAPEAAGVTMQGNFTPEVQQIAVSC